MRTIIQTNQRDGKLCKTPQLVVGSYETWLSSPVLVLSSVEYLLLLFEWCKPACSDFMELKSWRKKLHVCINCFWHTLVFWMTLTV